MKPEININNLVQLKNEDLPRALECLTDAFSEDPCFRYLLQSDNYDPDKAKFIHEYTLKYGCQNGNVYATSKEIEGISIWLPPKTNKHTSLMHAWNFIKFGGLKMDKRVNSGTIETMKEYGSYSSKLHHKYARESHWYLMSIGVAKKFQGKGLSKKLLIPMLDYFDKSKQTCYLETHNKKNVTYYERYGFKTMEVGKLPGSDQDHFAMLREPQSKYLVN